MCEVLNIFLKMPFAGDLRRKIGVGGVLSVKTHGFPGKIKAESRSEQHFFNGKPPTSFNRRTSGPRVEEQAFQLNEDTDEIEPVLTRGPLEAAEKLLTPRTLANVSPCFMASQMNCSNGGIRTYARYQLSIQQAPMALRLNDSITLLAKRLTGRVLPLCSAHPSALGALARRVILFA